MNRKFDWVSFLYCVLVILGLSIAVFVLGITKSTYLIASGTLIGLVVGVVISALRGEQKDRLKK